MIKFASILFLALSSDPVDFAPTESSPPHSSSATALPKPWLNEDSANQCDPSTIWIKVASERKLDHSEAIEEAMRRMSEAVVKVAMSHAGGTLSETEVRRHLLALLDSPQCQQDTFTEHVAKP